MKAALPTFLFLSCLSPALAAPDMYLAWASSKWGTATTGSVVQRSVTWGEEADPDRDGIANLIEYACDTDPTRHNPASDCWQFFLPDSGAPEFRYPQITAHLRTDDPDLRVLAQTSQDLSFWSPQASSVDFSQPQPVNPAVWEQATGSTLRGLRQMRYIDRQSMAQRSQAFMRLHVVRRFASASTTPIEPFTFTPGQTVATSSTARSSSITLAGFAGTLSASIPAGVTLFVNGIAQTGSSATVKAGDTLWMQATAPGIVGIPRSYTLTTGGQSATWTFTTATITAVPDHPGTDSGYTPVETGVSDTGAAQISIPIVVSPGTAGMQPKLSINYSSQGGNGPLGVGFSLSGLSTISRVGRTVAQDGVKGGVNFDANDRFALDGQRLIAINGADGADGTEYRLEFDPTSRIRSYGVVSGVYGLTGTGPAKWIVETKAGLTLEFTAYLSVANLSYPRSLLEIYRGALSAPIQWSISTITDSAGNKIAFQYFDSIKQYGEMLPTRIDYTSNAAAGLNANHSVVFEYEDRPDMSVSYASGLKISKFKRLVSIETRSFQNGADQTVRRYQFAYVTPALDNRSRLASISESCPSLAAPLVTQIDWRTQTDSGQFFTTGINSQIPLGAFDLVADFNGDGRTDYLSSNGGAYNLRISNGFGFNSPTSTGFGPGSAGTLAVDSNADGKTDLLVYNNARAAYDLYTFQDTSFGLPEATVVKSAFDPKYPTLSGDYNSDGRTDLLVWHEPFLNYKYNLYLSSGSSYENAIATLVESSPGKHGIAFQHTGDFNGDGMTDVITPNPNTGFFGVWYSTGNGFLPIQYTQFKHANVATAPNISSDYNGDGLTDMMIWNVSRQKYDLHFANGKGFQNAILTEIGGGYDAYTFSYMQSVDFNGDGMMDMMTANVPNATRQNVWISNGTGFGQAFPTSIFSNSAYDQVGDFNGDGTTDILVWNSPTSGALNTFYNQSQPQPLVEKVTSHHGSYTKFQYKPITDSSIYTKGTGMIYPCSDLQAAMFVVSSVTASNGIDGDAFTGAGASTLGENTVTYRYAGAWSCLNGRGFQGFKATETTDLISNIITRTEYEGSTPLLGGRVKHTEQRLVTAPVGGSVLISESDTTWNITTTTNAGHPNTYFVTEASSISKAYEVNRPAVSALVKTATRNGFSYDGYGNLLTSTTTTTGTETFTETVTNTYADAPTPTKWHLGRLATSSVTKTGPNPAGSGTISLTRASSFAYNSTTGLLTQEVIEPSGGTLRQQKDYTHDGFGNILTSTLTIAGEPPRTTSTTYTPDGRFVETTTNALNHTESKSYDPLLGNVLTQTGPNGLTTSWEYDAIGRPIKETRPDGTVTRSFYRRVTGSTVGAPPRAVHYVRVQSSGSAPKTVWYDLLDREIKTDAIGFDGRTVSAHKVFNNRGEVTHASQPYFAGDTPLYSTMLYDAVGRGYQQSDPGNRVTKTTYDGLTTTVTNPKNQTVSSTVNAMGWTVQSTDAANKTITRKYDPYGNLRFVTDPANNTTELRYDVRGNKTYMSEPNSGTSTFTYNGFGELKTQTNNANQTVSLSYDKLGRVLTRTEPEGVTTFEYDSAAQGIGQLARESSGDFVRSYFYDHLSRPVSTVESHGFHSFAVSRNYDGYGRPDAMTYPTGLATRQVYTANGHLSEVQNAATTQLYWRALAVNARGQITQEVQGNGVVTDRAFDADSGLIDGITSTFGTAGDVEKAEFDFDLIGNLTARRDKRYSTTFSETFGYDTLNRLQTVTTTGAAAVTAAYNDLGNITSRTDVGSFSYGAASTGPHALTGVTGGAFNKSCGYDAKGNRTTDGATSLTYSSFNKPVRMVKGGNTLRFDYGPDRALYRQTTFLTQPGGATSQTVREYIGGLYERETTSEGLVRHIHYIAGGSGVAAILTDERSAASPPLRLRYIHKDHLGSVDVITDSAGAVVERQSFDAWGRRRTVAYNSGTSTWSVTYPATPGSAETHRGFTGHEMLDAVGLVHMGGRIYDPITARFLSPDPFVQSPDNLQNLNRYSYVLNNPLSFTDPSGFFFKSIGKFFKKHWKTIVTVAVAVVTAVYAPGLLGLSGSWGAVAGGAAGGFGSAFSGTLLAGGSVGDALRAGLKGGAIGGISAGSADWVGGAYANYPTLKPFVHGVVQGGIRQATGGKFVHGFLSGSFSDLAAPSIGRIGGFEGEVAARTLAASVVGGTAEAIGGGKFANGAITGAFVHLFNRENHPVVGESGGPDLIDAAEGIGTAAYRFGRGIARAVRWEARVLYAYATSDDSSQSMLVQEAEVAVALAKGAAQNPQLADPLLKVIEYRLKTMSAADTWAMGTRVFVTSKGGFVGKAIGGISAFGDASYTVEQSLKVGEPFVPSEVAADVILGAAGAR